MKLFLLISILCSSIVNIGFTVLVNKNLFNKMAKASKTKLISEIKNKEIEDYDCQPPVGNCFLKKIQITELEINNISFEVEHQNLCFYSYIKGSISFDLDYNSTLLDKFFSLKINLETKDLKVCIHFTKSDTSVFGVETTAQAYKTTINLITQNSLAERAFNFMKERINQKVNVLLADKIQKLLKSTVEIMINQSQPPFKFDTANHIMVDYSPIGMPEFLLDCLTYNSKSHFFHQKELLIKKENKSPYMETHLQMTDLVNKDIKIAISHYMINQFLLCYFENTNQFLYTHIDNDIDRKIIIYLKEITNIFDGIEVNLSLAFRITFQAIETPLVNIAPSLKDESGGISGTMFVRVIFELIRKDESTLRVELKLEVAIRFITKLAETNKSIELKLKTGEVVEFSLVPNLSNIPSTKTQALFLNTLILVYVVNSIYEFQIPLLFPDEVKITDAELKMRKNFMKFEANLDFEEFKRVLI